MRRFIILISIAWLFALSAPDIYACFCIKPEVPQAISEARAVFTGEVVEIIQPRTNNPKAPLADRLYAIRFKVDKAWKGAASGEITILSDQGRAGCFSWGPFIKGEKYLVYAERRTPTGLRLKSLVVMFSCNRTALLVNTTEDINQLDAMRNFRFSHLMNKYGNARAKRRCI